LQFIDLQAQYANLKSRIDSRIQQVLDHGQFIEGPEVSEFKLLIQEFLGTNHAIPCGNGTDALLLGLMAMGVKQGDAVFCPAFTFYATAEAITACGATPVFVDCDQDTFNISPSSLEAAIKQVVTGNELSPKAVITVDLFGLPADYSAITDIAKKFDLGVLEDAAQSIGGEYRGKRTGSFGDVAITSFFPSKPLGCYGDGGAVFTNNDDYAELIRSFSHHGKGENKYDNVRVGMNSRLDTIQAAILIEKLEEFPAELKRRSEVAAQYSAHLDGLVTVPTVPEYYRSAWAQYTIRVPRREELRKGLAEAGIPAVVYYPKCLHQQPVFAEGKRSFLAPVDLSQSEKLSKEVLSLPMHPYLEDSEIDAICKQVKSILD